MFSFDTLQHGNIQPSAIDDAYVGLRNAMLDDGLDQDPVAGDGIFTSHISRPKFDVEADTYTVRVVAIAGGHMIAHDVPGLRILDGPPEEENDEDNDSVVDLLEDAFVMQDAGNDIRNLPNPTIVREMNEPPVAGAELTVPQGRHDAMTPEGGYEAGGFVFTIEISEDFLTWRRGGDEIVFALPQSFGPGADRLLVRFAQPLLEAADSCFMRVSVRRK